MFVTPRVAKISMQSLKFKAMYWAFVCKLKFSRSPHLFSPDAYQRRSFHRTGAKAKLTT